MCKKCGFESIGNILKNQGYAVREENGKKIYMHEEIMETMLGVEELPECSKVIHKNGDTLDNRRQNLGLKLK